MPRCTRYFVLVSAALAMPKMMTLTTTTTMTMTGLLALLSGLVRLGCRWQRCHRSCRCRCCCCCRCSCCCCFHGQHLVVQFNELTIISLVASTFRVPTHALLCSSSSRRRSRWREQAGMWEVVVQFEVGGKLQVVLCRICKCCGRLRHTV